MQARFLCAPLALSFLTLPPVDDAGLSFQGEAGRTVKKTFEEESSWTLDEMLQTMNGEDIQQDVPDLDCTNSRTTVVVDTQVKAEEGRLLEAKRKFESVQGSARLAVDAGGFAEQYEYELQSPIEGETALFRWDEKESRYRVSDESGKGREDFNGLSEDMDLRGLLPDEEIEKFDSWEIPAQALVDAMRCGGDKRLAPDGRPDGGYLVLEPAHVMSAAMLSLTELEEADGTVEAMWEDTEDGDVPVAVISLEFEIDATCDAAERVEFLLESMDAEVPGEGMVIDLNLAMKGTGELRWNLGAGHFESLTLEIESAADFDFSWDLDQGGTSFEIAVNATMTGDSSFEARQE